MLLADAAQTSEGKLYILGGGWSVCGPGPTPMALALKIDVPWDETNRSHKWELGLFDADGHEVKLETPEGLQAVKVAGEFEVGRPPGLTRGTSIDLPIAISTGPLPLPPGGRYVWKLTIDGETDDSWQLSFNTRPEK